MDQSVPPASDCAVKSKKPSLPPSTDAPQTTKRIQMDVLDSDAANPDAIVIGKPVSTPNVQKGQTMPSSAIPKPAADIPPKRMSIPIKHIPSKSDIALKKIAKQMDGLKLDEASYTGPPQHWAVEMHPMGFPFFTLKPIPSKDLPNPFAMGHRDIIKPRDPGSLKRGAAFTGVGCLKDVGSLGEDEVTRSPIKRPCVRFAPSMVHGSVAHATPFPAAASTPAINEEPLITEKEKEESTSP